MTQKISRRSFVSKAVLGGVGLGAAALLAGCGSQLGTGAAVASNDPGPTAGTGGEATPAAAKSKTITDTSGTNAAAIDKAHEETIGAFPAETRGKGGQRLEPKMDGDVKVFELAIRSGPWEVTPGDVREAWMINGGVPGPEIRVTEGDKVRIIVKNELKQSTGIHWHGLHVPNAMDGVTYLTQPPIKPGETFIYEFEARPAGTHMYHSHHNSTKQVGMGVFGPFIIEPGDKTNEPESTQDVTWMIADGPLGFTINGKGFPATTPLVAKKGERIRLRMIGIGQMYHPMHLHGNRMLVIAKDGYPLPQPYYCDNVNVAPGDRIDVIVEADNPGKWAFHCHVLTHVESEKGYYGLSNPLIVEE